MPHSARGLVVVRDRHDPHVLVFPNAGPVRSGFQLRVSRAVARHACAGELHAARMQDVTAPIDQHRVAVERDARDLHALRPDSTLQRRGIQLRRAFAERAGAETIKLSEPPIPSPAQTAVRPSDHIMPALHAAMCDLGCNSRVSRPTPDRN